MHTFTKIAIAAITFAAGPALAQGTMPHDGALPSDDVSAPAPPMTGSQESKLAVCKAMAPTKALNDPACVALMKDKPAAPKPGGADNHNGTPHGQPATPKP